MSIFRRSWMTEVMAKGIECGKWHRIKIWVKGREHGIYFDGKMLAEKHRGISWRQRFWRWVLVKCGKKVEEIDYLTKRWR